MPISRREFVAGSAASAGVLAVGFTLGGCEQEQDPLKPDPDIDGEVNAWVIIRPDNSVTIRVAKMEMGQGVMTSLAMIVAEELECRWEDVRTEYADVGRNAGSGNVYGRFLTDGSASVRGSRRRLQFAGANARTRLIKAAAERWDVDVSLCSARSGRVIGPDEKSIRFGDLVDSAARIHIAKKDVTIKQPGDFRLLGKPRQRLDVPSKTNGDATFGIDVRLPGMRYAAVRHSPVAGGRLKKVAQPEDLLANEKIEIVESETAVFAVADSFWIAETAIGSLEIEWSGSAGQLENNSSLRAARLSTLESPGVVAMSRGNSAPADRSSVRAVYETPYLAHACLEPQNCTVRILGDAVDVWIGTQDPEAVRLVAAEATGNSPANVTVHCQAIGGAFGRRIATDIVRDALIVARRIGTAIKLIWTREEDMRQGYFRPMTATSMAATLTPDRRIETLQVRTAGDSILAAERPEALKNGVDATSVMGLTDIPYDIPNLQIETQAVQSHIKPWFWRSVGDSQNAFAVESFIDEVAVHTDRDPLELRRALLSAQPRYRHLIDRLEAIAESNTPAGAGRGFAIHENSGTIVAQCIDVDIENGQTRVLRVVSVVDCGFVVNPTTATEQIEGAVIFGLSAAINGEIHVEKGVVMNDNFDSYPLMRMNACPELQTYFEARDNADWGGLGEPGVPPVAPALCNAIFAATGIRVRSLPVANHDLGAQVTPRTS